jgi:copper(I)-binding protein
VTLKNNTTKTASLVSVSSPLFSSIEIHRSIVKDEVASMERHLSLTIPAKSTIKLLPGDYHLMLFNPKTPLEIGDKPTLTFTFSNGVKILVKAQVKKRKYRKH